MRQVVEQLAKGQFLYERPELNTEDACISVRMGKNEIYEGSITLEVRNHKALHGRVYSSTPRVKIKESILTEDQAQIIYTICSFGLDAGEELNGNLTLVTDAGEVQVPFFVKILRMGSDSSMGNVRNLFHFTNLANSDYEEAYRIFISDSFEQIFSENEDDQKTLYRCLKRTGLTRAAMEEFLIGVHKKKRCSLRLGKDCLELNDMKETLQGSIPLEKENWGYLHGDISVDAPFLILRKKTVTSEDFVGKYCDFPFLVEVSRLHAGLNCGSITIRTKTQELTFTVKARKAEEEQHKKARAQRRTLSALRLSMTEQWLDYRTGKSSKEHMLEQMQKGMNELAAGGKLRGADPLLQAFFLDLAGEKEQTARILSGVAQDPKRMKDPLLAAALMWLSQKHGSEEERKKACSDLLNVHDRDRECWQYLWILLQMPEYRKAGAARILEDIREQIAYGCASPLLLAEGFFLLKKEPELLKKLTRLEVRIYLWALKEGLVDEQMAMQLGTLAQQSRYYDRAMIRLLTGLYDKFPSETLLSAIISCLMRGGFRQRKYFSWYKEGVERNLNIAGLYEYYIYTVGDHVRSRLPLPLVMYFQYNNTLDYRRKAFLYTNLYRYRKSYGNIYQQFEPQIDKFVTEQLMEQHIDRNLAFLYNVFLHEEMLTKELARSLTGMLFLHEVVCRGRHFSRVTAVHKFVDTWQTVPVQEQRAYVNMYMEDCKLVFTDEHGEIYVDEEEYELRQLLDTERFLPVCESFFPEDGMILMYRCCGKSEYYVINSDNIMQFTKLVKLPFLEPEFREKIRGDILAYCYENYDAELLEESLFDIAPASLNAADRVRLVEIYISRGMYDRTYELVKEYGYEKVSPKLLVRLCMRLIRRKEYEKDAYLTALCHGAFLQHKYDETVLQYLCDYFEGSMEELLCIRDAGENFDLQTFFLTERILMQRLFTGTADMADFDLLKQYLQQGGHGMVERAYLSYLSWEYFLDRKHPDRRLFEQLETRYREQGLSTDVCRLALLKYYAEHPGMIFRQEEAVRQLLEQMACGEYRFAFYQKLPGHLLEPYFISDKYFVEYRTAPGRQVYVHFRLNTVGAEQQETYGKERLPEVFGGVYNREFTLFYGDALDYFITEEIPGEPEKKTEETHVCRDDVFLSGGRDKYHLINDMLICQDLHDELTGRELLEQYAGQEALVKHFFQIRKTEDTGKR